MAGYQGYFLWHELMSTDPAGARAFYPAILGWGILPADIPGMEYDMWTGAAGPLGGLMQLPAEAQAMGAPTHWVPYIGTTDIDTTFARARELGATVYVPVTDIPDIGRFAVVADPQGATFAMYQPLEPADPTVDPQAGDFSWHELMSSDAPAGLAFYGQLFGWDVFESHDMGEMGLYHIFGRDGRPLGGAFTTSPDMAAPGAWVSYVCVANADDGAGHVSANGGSILYGPTDVPGGDRIVQCRDPQGGLFALHQLPALTAPPAYVVPV